VHNKAALAFPVILAPETLMHLLRPGRDFPVARDLPLPESGHEFRRKGRPGRALAGIDIECQVTGIGIGFVNDRRIEPLGQRFGAA
jgi:hypothetical protein